MKKDEITKQYKKKTNEISTFSLFGPTKAPYMLITLAIYGLT